VGAADFVPSPEPWPHPVKTTAKATRARAPAAMALTGATIVSRAAQPTIADGRFDDVDLADETDQSAVGAVDHIYGGS
jgi:hypothetical protein